MLNFNNTTQNTSTPALLGIPPKETKARAKQGEPQKPQAGAESLIASLKARGVDVDRLSAKAKEQIRQRGKIIDKVDGSDSKTIDDIKKLTAGDDGLQVSGVKDLKDDKGQPLKGAATTDGKIILNKNLEQKPDGLKATAIEEIAERTHQDIAKTQTQEGMSKGDFGAEVAMRVKGGATKDQLDNMRNASQNDTTTINGETAEAGLADKLKEQTKKNKTKRSTTYSGNSQERKQFARLYNWNANIVGKTSRANTAFVNAQNELGDLATETFYTTGINASDLGTGLANQFEKGLGKVAMFLKYNAAASKDALQADKAIVAVINKQEGWSLKKANRFRAYVWNQSLSSLFTNRTPEKIRASYQSSFIKATEKMKSVLDAADKVVSSRWKTEKLESAYQSANAAIFAVGLAAIGIGVGAIAGPLVAAGGKYGVANAVISGANLAFIYPNLSGVGGISSSSLPSSISKKFNGNISKTLEALYKKGHPADNMRAHIGALKKTKIGRRTMDLANTQHKFLAGLINRWPNEYGSVIADQVINHRFNAANLGTTGYFKDRHEKIANGKNWLFNFPKHGDFSYKAVHNHFGQFILYRLIPPFYNMTRQQYDRERQDLRNLKDWLPKNLPSDDLPRRPVGFGANPGPG